MFVNVEALLLTQYDTLSHDATTVLLSSSRCLGFSLSDDKQCSATSFARPGDHIT